MKGNNDDNMTLHLGKNEILKKKKKKKAAEEFPLWLSSNEPN